MSISLLNAKKSFLNIRNQCGLMGMLLPWLALFSAGIAEHPDPSWWWSISATYYLSPALPAVMMPVCLVLFNYIGYDKLDEWITNFSALAGLGLVLFPCKVAWIDASTPVGFFQVPAGISQILHGIFACSFFLLIAYNSIFLFTKSKPGAEVTKRKRIRNWIYRICGWGMVGMIFMLILTFFHVLPLYYVIYLEILLLTIFGFSWLVKGEMFPFLNDKK